MSSSFYSYPRYSQASAAELREKAMASVKRASGKGKTYEPVIVKGSSRQICTTWWGQMWCENLMKYADYSNRIGRGKRYVNAGSVIDLHISKGLVQARVQGTRRTPYKVEIHIDPLSDEQMERILNLCSSRISSLEDLAQGKFPEDMKSVFTGQDGLFPVPRQIHFDCSCPDWAYMCKHVAAVMYGIGVRLDENPFYFFLLRGIEPEKLLRKTVENKVEALLENADKPSDRFLDEQSAAELFSTD